MEYSFRTIAASEATLSENLSVGLLKEIMERPDWVCYSSSSRADIVEIVGRFMNIDARVPSTFGQGTTLALVPLAVLRFDYGDSVVEGWVYLNGAVVVRRAHERMLINVLVDKELATGRPYVLSVKEDQG